METLESATATDDFTQALLLFVRSFKHPSVRPANSQDNPFTISLSTSFIQTLIDQEYDGVRPANGAGVDDSLRHDAAIDFAKHIHKDFIIVLTILRSGWPMYPMIYEAYTARGFLSPQEVVPKLFESPTLTLALTSISDLETPQHVERVQECLKKWDVEYYKPSEIPYHDILDSAFKDFFTHLRTPEVLFVNHPCNPFDTPILRERVSLLLGNREANRNSIVLSPDASNNEMNIMYRHVWQKFMRCLVILRAPEIGLATHCLRKHELLQPTGNLPPNFSESALLTVAWNAVYPRPLWSKIASKLVVYMKTHNEYQRWSTTRAMSAEE